jgi:hypothetical protein
MIERGDANLLTWLKPLAGDAVISLEPPPLAPAQTLAINAYLFEIDRPPSVTSARSPLIELRLGYLLSVGGDASAAHALLGKILTDGLASGRFEIEFGSTVTATWMALSRLPLPSCIVRVRVTQDRGLPVAPPVTSPASVQMSGLQLVTGRVQSADGHPIVDAVLEIAALGRSAPTANDGTFSLGAVPRDVAITVTARAKDVTATVQRDANAPDGELVITMPLGTPRP